MRAKQLQNSLGKNLKKMRIGRVHRVLGVASSDGMKVGFQLELCSISSKVPANEGRRRPGKMTRAKMKTQLHALGVQAPLPHFERRQRSSEPGCD